MADSKKVSETIPTMDCRIKTRSSFFGGTKVKASDMQAFGTCVQERAKRESKCTQLVNGVHLCSEPKYGTVKDPKDARLDEVLRGEEMCVRFDHLPDGIGSMGHGDIPDNFLCFQRGKAKQYFEALVPKEERQHSLDAAKKLDFAHPRRWK